MACNGKREVAPHVRGGTQRSPHVTSPSRPRGHLLTQIASSPVRPIGVGV